LISHVHFPENWIFDNGDPFEVSAPGNGTGYTSGRTKSSPGVTLRSPLSNKLAQWMENEKARWESAWQFPAPKRFLSKKERKRWSNECSHMIFSRRCCIRYCGIKPICLRLVATAPESISRFTHTMIDAVDALNVLKRL